MSWGVAEPDFARAGEKGSWILNFVVARRVSPGQHLWLYIQGGRNSKTGWRNLQVEDPSKEGYVSLSTASEEALPVASISEDSGLIAFTLPDEGLGRGARLTAYLGGQAGAVVDRYSHPHKFLLLLTASPGEPLKTPVLYGKMLERIVGGCMVQVWGNVMRRVRLSAPSNAVPGKEIFLLVRPEDEYGNVASEELGELTVRVNGKEIDVERVPAKDSTCCVLKGIVLPQAGLYRLEVEDISRGLKAVSNPIRCLEKTTSPKVFWGMIHGHSEISDGAGSLDHYFTYMRDECGLDFGVTGDHDHLWETTDEMWQLTQAAVAKYNEPGRFTTFLGYEWAKWRKNGDGDRNVYYLHDRRPLFRSDDEYYPTPDDLFKTLKEETALIIPHHSAEIGNHCDWKDHDEEKERLVEIYSCWGSSERSVHQGNPFPVKPAGEKSGVPLDAGEVPAGFVQRALELGWRVGFTGGGDDHLGHPGDDTIHDIVPWEYKCGLMAVQTKENTRQSIWEALWNRRCYATTGARIIVDFQVDGYPMGSEILLSQHPELATKRKVSVSVQGTEQVKSVEVVRNNQDVYTHQADSLDVTFQWEDQEKLAEINFPPARYCSTPFTFYYLRVTQIDGEMAWVSPIWILS